VKGCVTIIRTRIIGRPDRRTELGTFDRKHIKDTSLTVNTIPQYLRYL
jgi:hypothetical protein